MTFQPRPAVAVIAPLLAILLGLTALTGTAPVFAQTVASSVTTDNAVGADVYQALEEERFVRVMILFEVANDQALSGANSAAAFRTSSFGRAAIADARDQILGTMAAENFLLRRQFESVNAVAVDISARGLTHVLDRNQGLRIDLDEGGTGHLTESVALVNLDDVHALGFTGQGVKVAVLDSGYDSDHADLSDDLVAEQCFCSDSGAGCCPAGGVTQGGAGSAEDDHGHGSNVTGIVTSAGNVADVGGAPDADIVAVKVLDSNNAFCCTSDVVAGLDWVATNHSDAVAINASLGTFAMFPGDCDTATSFTIALATAIDNLRSLGVATVVSAGNNGSGTEMQAPACVANSISVGAVYDANIGAVNLGVCNDPTTAADQVTCFSNSNATTDIFAPGGAITSSGVGGGTSTFFGTSQAAPHVAACAAVLREAAPSLTPDQLESAIEASTVMVTDTTNGLSFPRLDCLHALDQVGPIFTDGFESGDTQAWS